MYEGPVSGLGVRSHATTASSVPDRTSSRSRIGVRLLHSVLIQDWRSDRGVSMVVGATSV